MSAYSHAQDATPFEEIPGGFDVLTNAFISSRPELPSPPGDFDTSSIEALVNFTGLDDDNTKFPPDTYGAVGPSHVVTMLNSQVRISNRAGTTNYSTVTLSNFWGRSVGTIRPFDPRIIYDPYDQRWIATATANSEPQFINASSLLIGVSQTSDPTGAWHMHSFDVDANNLVWADYPSLGFNRYWVAVQVNMFNIAAPGAFNRSDFYVFNRTNLYAGGTNRTVLSRTGIGGTQVPAVTFNTNQATLYFLQTWNSNSTNGQGQVNGYLRLYTLTGSPGSETLTATTNFPMAEPWSSSPGNVAFAPQIQHIGEDILQRFANSERRLSQRVLVVCADRLPAQFKSNAEQHSVVADSNGWGCAAIWTRGRPGRNKLLRFSQHRGQPPQ